MRGGDVSTAALFSYVSCEARVPADHPLRTIRAIVDEALEVLSPAFAELYAKTGRPSIAPEKLMRALLLQAFCSARSERQLMEQLDYNLLFCWFVGLTMDASVSDVTVFTKNRERLVGGRCRRPLDDRSAGTAARQSASSDEDFSVNGTPIEAWASMKRFRPKDGSGAAGSGAQHRALLSRIIAQHAETFRSRRIKARCPGNCGLPRVSPGFYAIGAVALRCGAPPAGLRPLHRRLSTRPI